MVYSKLRFQANRYLIFSGMVYSKLQFQANIYLIFSGMVYSKLRFQANIYLIFSGMVYSKLRFQANIVQGDVTKSVDFPLFYTKKTTFMTLVCSLADQGHLNRGLF